MLRYALPATLGLLVFASSASLKGAIAPPASAIEASADSLDMASQFDSATDFSEGTALVQLGREYRYIDRAGKIAVIPKLEFDAFAPFSEGLAIVKAGETYGYINTKGEVAIPPQFDRVSKFHEGLAAIRVQHQYGFIDKKGNIVIPPQFQLTSGFFEG
jgi:hypothetical protein